MALHQSELGTDDRVGGDLAELAEAAAGTPVEPTETDRQRSAFLRNLPMVLCGCWIFIVVAGAVTADWLPIADPAQLYPVDRLQGPSSEHWFGTDSLGRDLFSRTVYGARVSLIVGVASVAIGIVIGSAIGIVAGYVRGRTDAFISWTTDVVLSFPSLILLLALVAYMGSGLRNISLALGFLSIPIYARLSRAHSMTVSSEEFVVAARASGATRGRVLVREILPNVLPPILAYGLIAMSLAIVIEGSLSYLGLSTSIPTPSWGGLIANGQGFLRESPSGVIIPSAILCLTVLSLNVIGERCRRRFEVGANG